MNRETVSNINHRWVTIALVILLTTYVIGIALMASVPPVSRDALIHHLAVPKLYLQHGGMIELPDIPFSYYPMNLDLLYLIPLMFGNDIIPKYIHMLFGLLTAWLIFHYLRSRIGNNYGLCGALLWLSTPIITRLSSEVYVDLGLAFFSFGSLYQIVRWADSGFRFRHLVYGAVLCGLALGTKYNALLLLTVLSLMIPFIYSRLAPGLKSIHSTRYLENLPAVEQNVKAIQTRLQPSIGALQSAFCFVGIALMVFSPWMIRNVVLKQNPIYPMMSRVFNPEEQKENDKWSRTSTMVHKTGATLATRRLVFKESFGYIALMPIRIFIEGQDDDPRRFDGKLNPFLLVFLIVGIWGFKGNSSQMRVERWIWFSYALLFLAFVILSAPIRVRYLVPILPAIIILAVIGIHNFHTAIKRYKDSFVKYSISVSILIGLITAMFLYNSNYLFERFSKLEPMTYLSGQVSRDNYIEQRCPEYPLVQYANTHLDSDDRLLGMFIGQRRYYYDRDITFNEGLLLRAVRRAEEPHEVMTYLREKRVTHLMVRIDLFMEWLSFNITTVELKKFKKFWGMHTEKLQESNGFALYAFKE